MYAETSADLYDTVLDALRAYPRQTARKVARRVGADAGAVRRALIFLASEHYAVLSRQGGQDVYEVAE